MVDKAVLQAKVHFVAGKGGVGKTLVSQALATFFARDHKTLLVELSEEEAGDAHPKLATIRENVTKNLSRITIFPDQALYEYLSLKIPQKKVLDSFLSKSLIKALGSAMPGLADLTRLGKIWFHADDAHEPKGEIYEKIVVDMPSSGFVGRFLTIASVVNDAVKIGPLAKEAKLIHDYFKDSHHARLHVVTMPQELVVNETIELLNEIKSAKGIHLGILFINRILVHLNLSTKILNAVEDFPQIRKVLSSFKTRLDEEELQLERFLHSSAHLPRLLLTEQIGEMMESKIVDEMVNSLSSGA